MKPYYEESGITIYHGDCRNVLPYIDMIDLVLTDPPYGIGGSKGAINKKRGKANYNTNLFEDTPEYVDGVVVGVVKKCLSMARSTILTPGAKCMFMYPTPSQIGVFYMPSGTGMGSWGWVNWQPIFYYGKNPRASKTIDQTSRVLNEKSSCSQHPCAKPLKAWTWLLDKGSLEGETILDPFMGSGTTLKIAKDLNRRAIGIEIDERYCEIAAKRLAQEVLFIDAI